MNKIEFHKLVNKLTKELDIKIDSMVINLLTGDQIIPINKKYLDHNFSTDIITFNYSGENYTLDGEIFISLDDATYYANKYDIELHNEILRLVVHGFLHMVGYDDKNSKDKRNMKQAEDRLVKKYFNSLNKMYR